MAVVAMEIDDRIRSEPAKPKTNSTMSLPHVESFFCCFGLEVGAKIIAYLHLLVSLCLVVVSSVYASKFGEMAGTVLDQEDHLYTIYRKITIGIAIISVGHVLLASTLLYGVYKRSTVALRVWVWIMSLLLLLALVLIVVNCALTGISESGSDIFLAFLEAFLFFGTVSYCVLCVYSYYLMLKSCEDMEGPSNTPY